MSTTSMDLNKFLGLLGVKLRDLHAVPRHYRRQRIPKEDGLWRELNIPNPGLKVVQRTLLRRVLYPYFPCHPRAMGFRRGMSVVDHANVHVGNAVLLGFDIQDFFDTTSSSRIARYLLMQRQWSLETANWILRLCTIGGGLPQGAPTSPFLSNVVNSEMDARLNGLALAYDGNYSRYADDMAFSFPTYDRACISQIMAMVPRILGSYGYRPQGNKTRVVRSHRQQRVAGLVVNEKVSLPRQLRRRLRAAQHRLSLGRQPVSVTSKNSDDMRPDPINETQVRGWLAYAEMVEKAGRTL